MPIAPGTVTLRFRREPESGAGVIVTVTADGRWYYVSSGAGFLLYAAPADPAPEATFGLTFSGAATWSVELSTPDGLIVRQIKVTA